MPINVRVLISLLFITICLASLDSFPARSFSATAAAIWSSEIAQAPAAQTFTATPGAIDETASLGDSTQVTLRIRNDTGSARTAHIYEALPPLPSAVVARKAIPESLRQVPLPAQSTRIDNQIARDIEASSDGATEFLVFLNDQADLSAAYNITDWRARGWFVYQTLQANAERSQRDLRIWLDARGLEYRPFWIVNAIAVRGAQHDVQALAGRADVALLRANHTTSIDGGVSATLFSPRPMISVATTYCEPDGICWNVEKVSADRVWNDFGVNGQGITVANIDSGVRYDHLALRNQYRGYRGPGDIVHTYNWFDPRGIDSVPTDAGDHGTHTMGTMVARSDGTTAQPAVGIAPGANWIATKGCEATLCSDIDLIDSAQWLLAPTDSDGQNPRPDLRPHVINNSWGDSVGDDDWYAGYTGAWRAAGIFPVFAAGNNNNSTCGLVGSPGDYADVVGVGATDSNDQIASFSASGPAADGRLKPDISAPGSWVLSTLADDGLSYGSKSGTSMATPHIAAAVALLWSANPALIGDYNTTYAILTESATPRTDSRFNDPDCSADTSPNNIYGHGRLDTYAAVAQARVDVPWLSLSASEITLAAGAEQNITVTLDARSTPGPGVYTAPALIHTDDLSLTPLSVPVTLTVPVDASHARVVGAVYDRDTGAALDADVSVEDGPTVAADATGAFSVTLAAQTEPYTITASAIGYVDQSQVLTVTAGITSTFVFSLTADMPRLSISSASITETVDYSQITDAVAVLRNDGVQTLSYTLSVPSEPFGVWSSGSSSAWIAPSTGATSVKIPDDGASTAISLGFDFPFYGEMYDEIYVDANGFLSFKPLIEQPFSYSCLPIPETPATAIVPFRVDLNPADGGSIRYEHHAEGFVLTFEDTPLFGQLSQTYTFQVVLMHDGRIRFNYQDITPLPGSVAVGVQGSNTDTQTFGCGHDTPIGDNLSLEWRPQPNAQSWIELSATSGEVAPGSFAKIPIRFHWMRPNGDQPFRSAVVISSNDLQHPETRLPVLLTARRAPYETILLLIFAQ